MNRKTTLALTCSFLFPALAFVVIAMKMFGGNRWAVAALLYGAGWTCLVVAIAQHRRSRVHLGRGAQRLSASVKENARFIAAVAVLILLAYLALVIFPAGKGDFITATRSELAQRIAADFSTLPVYLRGLDDAAAAIEKQSRLLQGDPSRLSPEDRALLLQLWSRYLAYSMQLEQIKHVHKHFYQINYVQFPDLNLRSFLMAYSAFTAGFEDALKLTALVGRNDYLKTLLNEPNDEHDIPRDAYLCLSREVTDANNLIRLHAGQAHLQILKTAGLLTAGDDSDLIARADRAYREILRRLGDQPELFAQTPKDLFEKLALTAWLPLQKGVAEGMSLVRTTHRENLISPDNLQSCVKELEPGDILLERRNWYLTNIGIPGFWPHTALYTGTLKEIDDYFGDVEQRAPPSAYIQATFPALFSNLTARTGEGLEFRVLEAIGPGIVPTAFEKSGHADYLAVLRPRLPKADKLKAVLKAFSFYQRPYDYNFDFITDNELVCSELIYKAYRPGEDKKGIGFVLIETAGRLLLPPNDIARKFDAAFGTDKAELDFVLFLDGSETAETARDMSKVQVRPAAGVW